MTIITTTIDTEHQQVVPIDITNHPGMWSAAVRVRNESNPASVLDMWDALLAAAPPAPSAWLPIESAPEGEYVLVLDSEYGVRIAIKHGGEWWGGYDSYGNDRELNKVTHWMPLPQPPEQAGGKVGP